MASINLVKTVNEQKLVAQSKASRICLGLLCRDQLGSAPQESQASHRSRAQQSCRAKQQLDECLAHKWEPTLQS